MKILLFFSFCVFGAWGTPVDQNVPFVEPEELDALLAGKQYEKFSHLMNLGDPELANPDRINETEFTPMFNKKLHGGDMLFSSKAEGRQGVRWDKRPWAKWPDQRVPYTISNDFSGEDRRTIQRSISRWNREVRCLKWTNRRGQNDYVHFFPGNGCYAVVGKSGNQQPISLGGGCVHMDITLHEMEHAIGIGHEQARPDRDNHVRILWDNIPPEWHSQYNKDSEEDMRNILSYDYYSVMHYRMWAPGTGKEAFQILRDGIDKNKVGAGKDNGLTDIDIAKINDMYC